MNFFIGMVLLRVTACGAMLWVRMHPADWSPFVANGLRVVCLAVLVVSLTRRFAILRNAAVLNPANWMRRRFSRAGGTDESLRCRDRCAGGDRSGDRHVIS
jgi:hypothetical protein